MKQAMAQNKSRRAVPGNMQTLFSFSTDRRVRLKRRHGAAGDGYWPGYVDALVNVVLNLMFLAAMLAVGSFVLGLEISRKILMPAMQNTIENVRQIMDQTQLDSRKGQSSTIEVIDSPASRPSPSVQIDRVRSVDSQTFLHVKFAADALQLSDSTRINMIPRLRELLEKNPEASFAVWAVSEADPQSRRVSFMRIMALRDALNKAGIENNRISTRILPGANTSTDGQLVYILVRSTQNRKEPDEQ